MTSTPALPLATLPVTLAAVRRSTRAVLRSPALVVSPVAQSLFFLLVYAGQLGSVGSGYLEDQDFISFLLPLILLTGVATGAGAAGTLVLEDLTSGYLDRLRLAHGSAVPFLVGPVVAALLAVGVQMLITVAGAAVIGYRVTTWSGLLGLVAVMLALGLGIALLSIALAVRTRSSASAGLVTLVVFGLSFFTGVFVPVEELAGWMRTVARLNPLTYVVDAARSLEQGAATAAPMLATTVLAGLVVAGIAACALALTHARRTR